MSHAEGNFGKMIKHDYAWYCSRVHNYDQAQ